MKGRAAHFFTSAIVYAIVGMLLGLFMGLTQDHSQRPTHAHLILIGWVTFALIGFFYHLFPTAGASRLATVHFWLAQTSFVALIIGLLLLFSGHPEADPIAGVSSMGLLASMLLFGAISLPVIWRGK